MERGDSLHVVVRPIDPATGRQKALWRKVPRAEGMGKRAYRQAAEVMLRELLGRYDERGYLVADARTSLREHLDAWLIAKQTEGLAPKTIADWSGIIRTRIAPAMGGMPLSAITPLHIRRYLQSDAATQLLPRLKKDGVTQYGRTGPASPRLVRVQYTILRAALQDAVDMELLARNPAEKVRAPGQERQREPRRLTWEEIAALIGAAERLTPRYACLYRLAVVTGMRVGGLLALRWENVDLGRGVLALDHQKTAASDQAMPIDADTAEALREHRKAQLQERLRAGPLWRNEGWVFANTEGGAPRYRQVGQRDLRRIVTAAGLSDVHMHDLRHTAGSRMLEEGVDPKTVADRLGHRDMAFFLRVYAGSLPSQHKGAADTMGRALARARAGSGQVR